MSWFISNPISAAKSDTPQGAILLPPDPPSADQAPDPIALRHIPELDGLRGLAVAAVVAFHGSSLARGGWLGVDVFFVLSGFLITRLLVREHEERGLIKLRRFYVRRALRLGPAYLAMLLMTIPLMLGPLHDKLEVSVFTSASTSLLYVANWVQVVRPQSTGPLIHTWSLAIEEQFYLIWPPLLLLVLRGSRSRISASRLVGGAISLTFVLTFGLSLWLEPNRLSLVTTTQGVGLLVGAFIALRPVRCTSWLAWTSALTLVVASLAIPVNWIWLARGGYLLLDVAAALLVLYAVQGEGSLCAALRWRWLRSLGLVSYGLYLYHYPIFMLAQTSNWDPWQQKIFEIIPTGLLTVVSYFALERPALRLKDRKWGHGDEA